MICIRICPLQQLYLYFCNYPLQQLFSYLSLKIVVLVFAQYGSCFLLHIQLQPERLAGTDSRLDVGFGSSLALFFFSSCFSLNDFVAPFTTLVYSFILGVIVSNSGVFVLQNAECRLGGRTVVGLTLVSAALGRPHSSPQSEGYWFS